MNAPLGGVAQLGERLTGSQEVRGSIPLVSTQEFSRTRSSLLVFLFEQSVGQTVYAISQKVLAWIYLFSYINERTAWGRSSAGRALDWQSRGQGFDPPRLHPRMLKSRKYSSGSFFIFEALACAARSAAQKTTRYAGG